MSFLTSTLGGDVDDYRKLLDSAYHCPHRDNLEFIVVVQSSTFFFNSYKKLAKEYEELNIYVLFQEGRGLSRGRNYAFSISNGKYLFFYDDDCWINTKDFNYLFGTLELEEPDILFTEYVNDEEVTFDMVKSYHVRNESKISKLYGKPSITISVKKDLFVLVGGFDEKIGLGTSVPSGEETDLLFRIGIEKRSFSVCFISGVNVRHNLAGCDRIDNEKYYGYGLGDGALIKRYSSFDRALYLIFIRNLVKDLAKFLLGYAGLGSDLYLSKLKGRLVGFFS